MDGTIAAISTAPGRAGISVIRISGPLVSTICERLDLSPLQPRLSSYRRARHPTSEEVLDHVLATCFPGPDSYTGEDLLEISTHGGVLVPQLVLDAAFAAGARPAERGEFTRRAYLNGKLDLVQAEATLELIDSRSPAGQRAALHQLERGLSRRLETMRRLFLRLQALLAYGIDFPEEDDGPLDPARVDECTEALRDELHALLRLAPEGEMLRDGALTVLAGRPNVGKSRLFNVLTGHERAIVTEISGTTRDAIEAYVSIEGYPFRLVDTAGLRATEDEVEKIGVEVARRYVNAAGLILFCVEAGRALEEDEARFLDESEVSSECRVILVRTKSDLVGANQRDEPGIAVSAESGDGIERLREELLASAYAGLREVEEPPLVTQRRQVRALEVAREELSAFEDARRQGAPPEIAATHVQHATHALEELLGGVTTDDVLDILFHSFCVGK